MKYNFVQHILLSIFDDKKYDSKAFYINKRYYTYRDLASLTSQIIPIVNKLDTDLICLYATDDIRTYASILAVWACGKAYVPLNPQQPVERHREVVRSVSSGYILSSASGYDIGLEGTCVLDISGIKIIEDFLPIEIINVEEDSLAYIIFTSGSTGNPKGVPISRYNLVAFVDSMDCIGLEISSADKCLQPFDLTFDFSVSSYLIPLVKGACVYTIPAKSIKFLYIAKLIEDHRLSVLQMVPSMMRNLLPYITELDLSSVKYNIFCGESLSLSAIEKWHEANPDMVTYNMYGPTEDTVFCSYYVVNKENVNKIDASNDIVSIGIPFKNSNILIVDDSGNIVTDYFKEGELCISGKQLTSGYWKNEAENNSRFFMIADTRYYRTGDICFWGNDSNLMFVGRKDFQVKINGYRVELGEIEKAFSDASNGRFCVAVPFVNIQGNTEVALVIEGTEYEYSKEKQVMISRLPKYEIPSLWRFIKSIPLNQNGKVDRNALKAML
ncbi:MAG: AMP-binding protein [Bacteroidales bacterium]|nr:AMP-binding protein [Bacteroidales bacterium]